jgi:Sigma-70 region 2
MAAVSVDALHRSENLNLHRFLLRKLGNPADAADAAQETYLRLVKALTTTDLEQPRLFLFHLARNVAANLGKRRRFEAGLFRSITDLELSSVVDGRAQTETQVIAREQLRLVAAAIDGLPPRRGAALPRGVPPQHLRGPLERGGRRPSRRQPQHGREAPHQGAAAHPPRVPRILLIRHVRTSRPRWSS